MSSKFTKEHSSQNGGRKKGLVRSDAMCGDDDTHLKSPVRLVNSQTKPALSSSLSKDSVSTVYTDATGIDLKDFIRNTVHKNARDRQLVLEIELRLSEMLTDPNKHYVEFGPMTSYDRMIVHRISAFFGLDHNVTQDGTAVVATKTPYSTSPPFKFETLIESDQYTDKPRNMRSMRSRQNSDQRYAPSRNMGDMTDINSSLSLDLVANSPTNGADVSPNMQIPTSYPMLPSLMSPMMVPMQPSMCASPEGDARNYPSVPLQCQTNFAYMNNMPVSPMQYMTPNAQGVQYSAYYGPQYVSQYQFMPPVSRPVMYSQPNAPVNAYESNGSQPNYG